MTSRSRLIVSASLVWLSPLSADIVSRPAASLSLTDDAVDAVVADTTDLTVLANDTITDAGEYVLTVPATSDQGGTLTAIGDVVRYAAPTSLAEGATDSFTYTVTEEGLANASGTFAAQASDQTAAGDTFVDPGNGGTYTVTTTSGFADTVWDGVQYSSANVGGGIDTSSLYRYIIQPDLSADIAVCPAGLAPQIDVTIRWNLTKIAGNAAGYEASIARGTAFPLASDFPADQHARENNWPVNETRELVLTLADLTPDDVNNLRIGLWAQDAQSSAPGDENDWRSNSVAISYDIDTSNCPPVSSTATVTVTLIPPPDSDGDSIIDKDDLDDDNDGIADALEQQQGADVDTDGDGVVDRLDLDSDNDAITDLQESGADGLATLDTDRDGRIDGAVGSNGMADAVETGADSGVANFTLADSDTDGVADFRDLDSDNDGIPDVTEAGAPSDQDADNDGRLDGAAGTDGLVDALQTQPDVGGYDLNADGTTDHAPDTDEDGVADFKDLDSDGDTIPDLVEAGGDDEEPAAGDGRVDGFQDDNGDGFDDGVAAVPLTTPDTDADGQPNFQDVDSDGDGVSDAEEGLTDADGNGVPDYLQASGRIETGLSGGGCTVRTSAGIDPTLGVLALMAMVALYRRRAKPTRRR